MVLSNDRSATYLVTAFIFGLIILSKLNIFSKILTFAVLLLSIIVAVSLIPSIKDRYINSTFMEILGKKVPFNDKDCVLKIMDNEIN